MADIDTIKVTQDNLTTTYFIKDNVAREMVESISTIQGTPDTEISLLRAGFNHSNIVYPNAYAAIESIIPRWKVCS